MILPDILIPNILKNLSWQLSKLIPRRMNKMTKVSSRTPRWPVIIPTRHGAVITRLNYLVRVWWGIRGLLRSFDLVLVLESLDGLCSHGDEFVVFHRLVLGKDFMDVFSLIYTNKRS